jgi:long-subunit acyl-CoA synthetase (AMP-forming)
VFSTLIPSRKKLFKFFVEYRNSWMRRGYDTPIAKALIFKKMRAVVGGKLRMLLSGGAPLAEEAHVFIRLLNDVRTIAQFCSRRAVTF